MGASLASILVAACATSADMRSRAPAFTGETLRPLPEYAGCVQEGWLDRGVDAVNYAPMPNGITLSTRGPSGYELLLDSRASNGRSIVTMYSRMAFGEAKFIEVARACL